MNQIWLQIFAVMIGGSMVKYLFYNPFFWVVIDLAVLGIAYLLLRRYPFIDLRGSMIFLGGLTVINVLCDIGILSGMVGNLAMLALLGWMMFGGGSDSGSGRGNGRGNGGWRRY